MKRIFRTLLWLTISLLLLAGATIAYFSFSGLPSFDPPAVASLHIDYTPERIAQGAKIASMVCKVCHTGNDGKLSGKLITDIPEVFGTIYSRNITRDSVYGIGRWSDAALYHFLRTGVRADGSYAPAYMPKFANMADEDLYSIIAWLHSDDPKLQPSQQEPPPCKPSLLANILSRTVMGPPPLPNGSILLPDTTKPVEEGRYLANCVYGCYSCHSADFKSNNDLEPEKSAGFYGGGNPLLNLEKETVHSANITPDPESGIGKYTESDFMATLRSGKKPDGTVLRYPMLPHPNLNDREIKAIYAYLKTVPAIHNQW